MGVKPVTGSEVSVCSKIGSEACTRNVSERLQQDWEGVPATAMMSHSVCKCGHDYSHVWTPATNMISLIVPMQTENTPVQHHSAVQAFTMYGLATLSWLVPTRRNPAAPVNACSATLAFVDAQMVQTVEAACNHSLVTMSGATQAT